jgi:hypothetical protein
VKRPPVPCPRIYDLYWYSASERQEEEFARLDLPFGGLWGTTAARHRLPGPVLTQR